MKSLFVACCYVMLTGLYTLSVQAAEPTCFVGQWKLDADASDSAERLLNKMKRKQKEEEHFRARPVIGADESKQDLSLPETIPSFVFNQSDLTIAIDGEKVSLQQEGLQRLLRTDGASKAVSLSALQQHGNTMVAGWDKGTLVVETTTLNSSHVTEIFSLPLPGELHIRMSIKHELEKKPTVLEKVYHLASPLNPACDQGKDGNSV